MGKEPGNLMDAQLGELRRCRDLLSAYEEIGPAGVFGATLIRAAIVEGEAAIASGDVLRLLRSYADLQTYE